MFLLVAATVGFASVASASGAALNDDAVFDVGAGAGDRAEGVPVVRFIGGGL